MAEGEAATAALELEGIFSYRMEVLKKGDQVHRRQGKKKREKRDNEFFYLVLTSAEV